MTTPRPPLLSLDDALVRLLDPIEPLTTTELLPTTQALGRVLAADVCARVNVPAFDNSAMDGYALHTQDLTDSHTVLPVSQRLPAGTTPSPLSAGTAARIFTGAGLPQGANAVVMQEHCEALPDGRVRVRVLKPPQAGASIRRVGEDLRAGAQVLPKGLRLTPQALGLAAASGAGELRVVCQPKVALFSTGNELVLPGEPLPPGGVYNANRYMLRALIEAWGGHCTDLGIAPDQLPATRDMLRHAAQHHDLVLSSGGVSVGEEDHLRAAVQQTGQLDLWQIAIKPGKPLAFGRVRREAQGTAWFIGLPGNPVSSFVTALLAVRPVLKRLQGSDPALPPAALWRADFDWPGDPRREFLRVRRNAQNGLDLFANQSSGVLTSAVWGDGLVDNPAGQAIQAGDMVRYRAWTEYLA